MIDTGLPELAILGSAMLYGGAVVFLKKVVGARNPGRRNLLHQPVHGARCLIPTILLRERR